AGNTDAGGELRLEQLTPREYRIEVESPHRRSSQKSFTLEPQEELVVAIKLERELRGSLEIKCDMAGARVELDGKEIGVTDAKGRFAFDSVEVGRRHVRLTYPKHLPAVANVEIEAWRRASLDLTLEPRPGFEWLRIIAPAAVAVFLSLIASGAYRKWFHKPAPPIVTPTPIEAGNSQAGTPAPPGVSPTTNVATNGPSPETTATPDPSGVAVAPTVIPPASHVSFDELMAKAAQARKARRYQEAVNYYRQALTLRREDGKAIGGVVGAHHDLGGYFF